MIGGKGVAALQAAVAFGRRIRPRASPWAVEFHPVGVGEAASSGWAKRFRWGGRRRPSCGGQADRLVGMYLRPCGESIWACQSAGRRIGVPRRLIADLNIQHPASDIRHPMLDNMGIWLTFISHGWFSGEHAGDEEEE